MNEYIIIIIQSKDISMKVYAFLPVSQESWNVHNAMFDSGNDAPDKVGALANYKHILCRVLKYG